MQTLTDRFVVVVLPYLQLFPQLLDLKRLKRYVMRQRHEKHFVQSGSFLWKREKNIIIDVKYSFKCDLTLQNPTFVYLW